MKSKESKEVEVNNKVETTKETQTVNVPELTTQELLQAALLAGNFAEVAKLAHKAKNEAKLAFLASQAAKAEQAKVEEQAKVKETVEILIDQLKSADGIETFRGLWNVINGIVPAPVKVTKVTKDNGNTGKSSNPDAGVGIDGAEPRGKLIKDSIAKGLKDSEIISILQTNYIGITEKYALGYIKSINKK